MPLVTEVTTLILLGLISFKFGPIWAYDSASAKVWQVEQTALFKKTSLPNSKIGSECAGIVNKLVIKKKLY